MGDQASHDELDVQELLGWTEFMCWAALLMAPLIYWLQGPAVSRDQLVVRTLLVVLAAVGGVALRLRAIVRRNRERRGRPTHAAGGDVAATSAPGAPGQQQGPPSPAAP